LSVLEEQVSHYVGALRGADRESAHRRLIELGPQIISFVMMSFQKEHDPSIRATLVNIAWQMNSTSAIPLLTEALDDPEPGVWKEALDGLVSLRGPDALEVIRQARRRAPEKAEWLDEAIKQITDQP
jgi:hypothetical protein